MRPFKRLASPFARVGAVYLLVTCVAHAESPFLNLGPGTGGGGGGVVCMTPQGHVQSVELNDLAESAFYEKTVFSPKLARMPWEQQVKTVMNRIAFADPEFHAMLWERVQTVKREFAHAMDETHGTDVVFPAPQDLSHGRVPPLHLGCQVAGIAVFNDAKPSGQRLKISELLWRKLSPMHKAALIMHESVYLTHRDIFRNLERPAAPDSSATRAFVGFLFSAELEKSSESLKERAHFSSADYYRGIELPLGEVDPHANFRNRLQTVLKPLAPYFVKNAERPLFASGHSCHDGPFTIQLDADKTQTCEMTAIIYRGIGRNETRTLEGANGVYSYVRHADDYLEALRVACKGGSTLHPSFPGFSLRCGSEELARVRGGEVEKPPALAVKSKVDFENTFLRDFDFE